MSDQEGVVKEKEKKKLSEAQEELGQWIYGHIPTPSFTFFTKSPPFKLEDLYVALHRAIKLVAYKLVSYDGSATQWIDCIPSSLSPTF